MKPATAAYTLVEVLVAVTLITIAVAAAASLALATAAQEEMNARVARCTNLNEQAARLYQLGMSPDAIANLLPPDPSVTGLDFSEEELAVPNSGTAVETVQKATSTLTFVTSDTSDSSRTNVITAIRPSIR